MARAGRRLAVMLLGVFAGCGVGGAGFAVALAAAPVTTPCFAAIQEEPDPADDTDERPARRAARLARLVADREQLEKQLAAMEAFGYFEPVLEAAHRGMLDDEVESWVRVRGDRGWLSRPIVRSFYVWNTPAEGRELPVYADHELPLHPYPIIVDFAQQLRRHDIDFLLLHVPSRLQVYPELLADVPSEGFAGMAPGATRFLLQLADEGVEVLDLTPWFVAERGYEDRDELFLDENQHWTPRGAELTAKILDQRLRQYPWFEQGPMQEGKHFQVVTRTLEYDRAGKSAPPGFRPQKFQAQTLEGITTLETRALPPDASNQQSPIAILGGSYLGFMSGRKCDLSTQIMRFTGHPLDVVADRGGGILTTRQTLRERRDELKRKHIVIWLLSSCNFEPGEEWQRVRVLRRRPERGER